MIRIREKKRRVFEFIERYIASNHEPPTMAEIGRQFQLRSSSTVHQILKSLESEGLIRRTPNVSRGIEIVKHSTPMVGWIDR